MADIEHINFACPDPEESASFWAAALDGERRTIPEAPEFEFVDQPDGGPSLMFREAPRGTDRDLPIHLDLSVEDRAAAVDRLRELGATVRETKTEETDEYAYTWTVMEDPAGNGFCVNDAG